MLGRTGVGKDGDIIVRICDSVSSFDYEVLVGEKTDTGHRILTWRGPDTMEWVEVKRGAALDETIKPTFIIPRNAVKALLEALQDIGIKLPEQSFVQGKLQAMEAHLEDVRRILFNGLVVGKEVLDYARKGSEKIEKGGSPAVQPERRVPSYPDPSAVGPGQLYGYVSPTQERMEREGVDRSASR